MSFFPAAIEAHLDSLGGFHAPAEARELARLAGWVDPSNAIVEVGSYIGVSALWLAAGAEYGQGARVTCVDSWRQPEPHEKGDHPDRLRTSLARFQANMEAGGWPCLALRCPSLTAASFWVQPIGLLFQDADHSYQGVAEDFHAWEAHIVPGGWLALHDYLGEQMERTEVARVVDEIILPSGKFEEVHLVERLWVGRKTC